MADKVKSFFVNSSRPAPNGEIGKRNGFGYIINSMFIFSIIGMCIKIFFGGQTSSDGSYGQANSTIWGYGIVAMSILTVVFISFAIHDRIGQIEKKGVNGLWGFIKSFLGSSGPSIITICILLWIITLNALYFKKINSGAVAKEYFQLSAGTSFLFFFQVICIFQYLKMFIAIKTKEEGLDLGDAKTTMTRMAFATYFIMALNVIVVGMMTILLEFFSTDG